MTALRGVGLTALVLDGLLAGLYLGFAVGVMPGLARAPADVFVATMVAVNRAIVNPLFLVVFVGAPLTTLAAAVIAVTGGTPARGWTVAAVLVVAATLVTIARSVPLNDALDSGHRAGEGVGPLRDAFEIAWVRWNLARTMLHVAAFVAAAVALVRAAP